MYPIPYIITTHLYEDIQFDDKIIRTNCPCCEKVSQITLTCDRCQKQQQMVPPDLETSLRTWNSLTGWLVSQSLTEDFIMVFCPSCRFHYKELHKKSRKR